MTNLNKIEVLGMKYVLKNVHVISEQIASNKLIFESWVLKLRTEMRRGRFVQLTC